MHDSNSEQERERQAAIFSWTSFIWTAFISSWQAFIFALNFGFSWLCSCFWFPVPCSGLPCWRDFVQAANSEQERPRQASIFSSKQARALASTFLLVSSCCPCPDGGCCLCGSPLGKESKQELNSAQVFLPKQASSSLRISGPISPPKLHVSLPVSLSGPQLPPCLTHSLAPNSHFFPSQLPPYLVHSSALPGPPCPRSPPISIPC